jgi:hypothetical protein
VAMAGMTPEGSRGERSGSAVLPASSEIDLYIIENKQSRKFDENAKNLQKNFIFTRLALHLYRYS